MNLDGCLEAEAEVCCKCGCGGPRDAPWGFPRSWMQEGEGHHVQRRPLRHVVASRYLCMTAFQLKMQSWAPSIQWFPAIFRESENDASFLASALDESSMDILHVQLHNWALLFLKPSGFPHPVCFQDMGFMTISRHSAQQNVLT